jgi:predicted phage terminase large subunit-like protein
MNRNFSMNEYHAILRNDLASFVERSFFELNPQTEFLPASYIELMAAALEKCCTGETKRLIINLPPRTLKSHAATVAFPAWLLGRNPTTQIICASYGQDLAEKHARDCRTLVKSGFYQQLFPATVLSEAKQAVNDFMTTQQGFRMATSVGGVLTGRGADMIILDDILKPDDALSDTRRNAANEWYFNTLLSRLNSKEHGVIIIVMQRLHQQDLVGEVLDRGPWEVLSLPALAIDDECYPYRGLFGVRSFNRKAGDPLHPERDSKETLVKIREAIGEYHFQSQYQQSPVTREGGIVKREWIKFYKDAQLPNYYEEIIQSWDTASKTRDTNDYSVCTTWKCNGENFYLMDVYRARLTYPELKKAAVELYRRFHPGTVIIEDQASGTALIQELEASGLYGIKPYRAEPGSDKRSRFHGQSIKFENGKVFLPQQAPWLDEYIREITGFPGTKHDDQVDSTTQALEHLNESVKSYNWWRGMERLSALYGRYPRESW